MLTQVAERAITADLETLISKAVDSSTADYAVVTGVQIHNWSDADFNDQQPTMEFIYPSTIYAVIDGRSKCVHPPSRPAWCMSGHHDRNDIGPESHAGIICSFRSARQDGGSSCTGCQDNGPIPPNSMPKADCRADLR